MALAFIISAVAGGIAWDVLKFPLTKAIHIAMGHNRENDISGYWLGYANSQIKRDYTATELLYLQKAGTKLKGQLYQLTSDSKFYVYSVTGYMRGNYISLCYQISGKGIQTGVFSLALNNQKGHHFGSLSGIYTEFYDDKKKHKSTVYSFENVKTTGLEKLQLRIPWCKKAIVSQLAITIAK